MGRIILSLALLACFGAGVWFSTNTLQRFLEPLIVVEPITVPVPESSRNRELVFPSDRRWSGGVPYVEVQNLTFANLPPEALCSLSRLHHNFEDGSFATFQCGWSNEREVSPYVRTHISVPLIASPDIWDWHYDRASSTLYPEMRTFFWARFDTFLLLLWSGIFTSLFGWGVWASLPKRTPAQ